jgi:hypothetical protein
MKLFAALLLATLLAASSAKALDYDSLAPHYHPKEAPEGFLAFSQKHGVDSPNTCAVRLSYALFLQDKTFFRDVTAKSGIEWLGLVVRADDLAIILNGKLGKAKRHESPDAAAGAPPVEMIGKKGIVFFDKLAGWDGGTGHISLWDGRRVVDQEDGGSDFFRRGERVYFWAL